MSQPARKLATWDDVAGLPEGTRSEIIAGEIVTAPRPSTRHGHVHGGLVHLIGGPFGYDEEPGGWWILLEVDIELDRHELVEPDLAGWRRQRVPVFPVEKPVRIVPDWICEILSPGNRAHDLVTKANLYLRHGVAFYWIIDPEEQTLEARALQGAPSEARWLVLGTWTAGDRARIAPFETIELDVGRLFPPP